MRKMLILEITCLMIIPSLSLANLEMNTNHHKLKPGDLSLGNLPGNPAITKMWNKTDAANHSYITETEYTWEDWLLFGMAEGDNGETYSFEIGIFYEKYYGKWEIRVWLDPVGINAYFNNGMYREEITEEWVNESVVKNDVSIVVSQNFIHHYCELLLNMNGEILYFKMEMERVYPSTLWYNDTNWVWMTPQSYARGYEFLCKISGKLESKSGATVILSNGYGTLEHTWGNWDNSGGDPTKGSQEWIGFRFGDIYGLIENLPPIFLEGYLYYAGTNEYYKVDEWYFNYGDYWKLENGYPTWGEIDLFIRVEELGVIELTYKLSHENSAYGSFGNRFGYGTTGTLTLNNGTKIVLDKPSNVFAQINIRDDYKSIPKTTIPVVRINHPYKWVVGEEQKIYVQAWDLNAYTNEQREVNSISMTINNHMVQLHRYSKLQWYATFTPTNEGPFIIRVSATDEDGDTRSDATIAFAYPSNVTLTMSDEIAHLYDRLPGPRWWWVGGRLKDSNEELYDIWITLHPGIDEHHDGNGFFLIMNKGIKVDFKGPFLVTEYKGGLNITLGNCKYLIRPNGYRTIIVDTDELELYLETCSRGKPMIYALGNESVQLTTYCSIAGFDDPVTMNGILQINGKTLQVEGYGDYEHTWSFCYNPEDYQVETWFFYNTPEVYGVVYDTIGRDNIHYCSLGTIGFKDGSTYNLENITIVDLAFTDDVNHRFGTNLPTRLRLEADFKEGSINMTIKGEWYKPDGHQIYVNITDGIVTCEGKSILLKNGSGLAEATRLYLIPPVEITRPEERNLYIRDRRIIPLPRNTIIIGEITIEVNAYMEEMSRVEFYIDNELKYTDKEGAYQWTWNEKTIGKHEIKIIAYNVKGSNCEDKINVMIFNLGG